jgi:Flp pilus assembly pilin Flp
MNYNPDDKDVAMICILILGIVACFTVADVTQLSAVLTGAITALGALASGRGKNGNGG